MCLGQGDVDRQGIEAGLFTRRLTLWLTAGLGRGGRLLIVRGARGETGRLAGDVALRPGGEAVLLDALAGALWLTSRDTLGRGRRGDEAVGFDALGGAGRFAGLDTARLVVDADADGALGG